MERTSFSLNMTDIPFFDTRMMFWVPSVGFTSISSSPSLRTMAVSPFFLTFAYSSSFVYLTMPFFVAMKRYFSSPVELKGIIAVIFSSG